MVDARFVKSALRLTPHTRDKFSAAPHQPVYDANAWCREEPDKPEEREARIQAHMKRIRSDPRWRGEDERDDEQVEKSRGHGRRGGRPPGRTNTEARLVMTAALEYYDAEPCRFKRGEMLTALAAGVGVSRKYASQLLGEARRERLDAKRCAGGGE